MIVLKDQFGIQVLPRVEDDRATVTGWTAYCALDADLRTSVPVWADVARNLFIDAGDQ